MSEDNLDNELMVRIVKAGIEGKALDYKSPINWNKINKK